MSATQQDTQGIPEAVDASIDTTGWKVVPPMSGTKSGEAFVSELQDGKRRLYVDAGSGQFALAFDTDTFGVRNYTVTKITGQGSILMRQGGGEYVVDRRGFGLSAMNGIILIIEGKVVIDLEVMRMSLH